MRWYWERFGCFNILCCLWWTDIEGGGQSIWYSTFLCPTSLFKAKVWLFFFCLRQFNTGFDITMLLSTFCNFEHIPFKRYFEILNQVIWSEVSYILSSRWVDKCWKDPLSLSHLTFLLPWIKDITRQESKLSPDKKNTACSGRDEVMWLSSNDLTSGGSNFQNPFLSPESSSNVHQRRSWGSSCILNIFIFGRYLWAHERS